MKKGQRKTKGGRDWPIFIKNIVTKLNKQKYALEQTKHGKLKVALVRSLFQQNSLKHFFNEPSPASFLSFYSLIKYQIQLTTHKRKKISGGEIQSQTLLNMSFLL